MPTVILVCTGNLCRSPMAEALLRARLARDEVRENWQVGSAGVWTVDGRLASTRAVGRWLWSATAPTWTTRATGAPG